MRRIIEIAILIAGFVVPATQARAHFPPPERGRVIHIAEAEGGLNVYIRLPMPLVVVGAANPADVAAGRAEIPYTKPRTQAGRTDYLLDFKLLKKDPLGLARMAADGHKLRVGDSLLSPTVRAIRLHPNNILPRFNSLADAESAFKGPLLTGVTASTKANATMIDIAVFYPWDKPLKRLSISSTLAPNLAGFEKLPNLVLNHVGGETKISRIKGLLTDPRDIDDTWLSSTLTFVRHGAEHIVEGLDHVLFVICLTIGAASLGNLVWRITGFTLGHSASIIGGFFGFIPPGSWFIPAVETAIALSIIYVAVIALLQRQVRSVLGVTAAIGVMHGYGFSFGLSTILGNDAANLWVSLAAFNVGVEIGQLAIVLVVWTIYVVALRIVKHRQTYVRGVVAVPAIGIATVWVVQRLTRLVQASFG